MFLYMDIAPGQRQTTPWGQNFDVNKHLVTSVICYKFLPLNDFLSFFLKKCIFSHIIRAVAGQRSSPEEQKIKGEKSMDHEI